MNRKLPLLALIFSLVAILPSGAIEHTTHLDLPAGWFAIWLNVDPVNTSGDEIGQSRTVEEVFSDPAIDIVARPDLPVGSAEFISDSSSGSFNQDDGWLVWRRTSELSANTLTRVRGNRAYLVHTTADTGIDIAGQATFHTPTWIPASYNLVGFNLTQPLSFDDFFGASDGNHLPSRIFRLAADGNWNNVRGSDLMRPGESYWVYAERSSNYMGPVAVAFTGSSGLTFGDNARNATVDDPQGNPGDTLSLSTAELTLTNTDSTSGLAAGLKKVTPATTGANATGDALRLFHLTPRPDSLDYAIGASGLITDWTIGNIAALATTTVTLGAHRNWSDAPFEQENLYRIEVAISGTTSQFFWLPASATLSSAPPSPLGNPAPTTAGLWLGEVLINRVTSLTEPGNPLRPTTSRAPLSILLHVDASGVVSLLEHVTLMQTRTADPSIVPDEVLVVDDAKIPFFEGVQNPDGTRTGRRFESAAFDLPRKFDTTTQVDLSELVFTTTGGDTPTDFQNYIAAQDARPPSLVEAYHTSWPLEGGLSIGASVSTATAAPLHIDPFHRANPFRHAFHPAHAAGPSIARHLAFSITDQPAPGQLTGTFQETVTGLTAADITATGILTLHRISTAPELQ